MLLIDSNFILLAAILIVAMYIAAITIIFKQQNSLVLNLLLICVLPIFAPLIIILLNLKKTNKIT